jgi:hypothetical protein
MTIEINRSIFGRHESDLVTSIEKRPSMQSRGGSAIRMTGLRPRVELLANPPSAPIAQRINEQRKCRRRLAPTRVIEMIADEQRTPVRQHAHEATVGDMRFGLVF